MTMRIWCDIAHRPDRTWRRWRWSVRAHRGFGTAVDGRGGWAWTRWGAQAARDRAADRLRRTHGGGA